MNQEPVSVLDRKRGGEKFDEERIRAMRRAVRNVDPCRLRWGGLRAWFEIDPRQAELLLEFLVPFNRRRRIVRIEDAQRVFELKIERAPTVHVPDIGKFPDEMILILLGDRGRREDQCLKSRCLQS